MADPTTPTLTRQLAAFTALPVQRQLGLLLGLAMVIALAAGLAIWGMRPTYKPLLPGMAERDVAEAMKVLSRQGVKYRIDPNTGTLMVPAEHVQEARLELATAGLPREEGVGFELLDQQTGIGTSRLVQTVRYQRALEGELARSVATLAGVDSARVHLALPHDSVFVRDQAKPAASVLVNMHPGRTLDDREVAGIVHLIASSVPELTPERVTVVDQRGRLLTSADAEQGSAAPSWQLEYTRKLEQDLRRRVEDILTPLVGKDGMRVQVTAQMNFRQVESTREQYDPKGSVLRSEQTSEEEHSGLGAVGIPGALSNEPPAGATIAAAPAAPGAAPGKATAAPRTAAAGSGSAQKNVPVNRNTSSTRNYEVDRTISHVREDPASLDRLSVAVVVDYKDAVDKAGKPLREPRSKEEMQHLTALVEKAVGFDASRGDSVNVINASFREADAPAPLPPLPIWQQPWAQDLLRQALAGLGVLLLALFVLRPTLKSLARPTFLPASQPALSAPPGSANAGAPPGGAEPSSPPRTLEGDLEQARKLTHDDPRLVAQVVRQWMQTDD